ncbi:fatty acyl-AMP ligase [Carnimonas bestiolae]|uniref:fatty acyl-AMP ligase n=1 Tax=Carnimonas bestiolae TaxID=3402172 RepID=UPI003EDC9BA4
MSSEASCVSSAEAVTPTRNTLPLRRSDFATLAEALDYAAKGVTGANFYVRGKLDTVLPYATLRAEAQTLAQRLLSLELPRGARIAIVGETSPDFLRFFFACQYIGLVPVALPATVNLGGHAAYVEKMRGMLKGAGASVVVGSKEFIGFVEEAVQGVEIAFWGTPATFNELPPSDAPLQPTGPDETAYMQFTSGSTGFPKAAMVTERALSANMYGASVHGVDMTEDDRFVSWLPFYHDMGLIGCLLTVVSSQRSVDYIDTREFAMRPRRWLELISNNRATITYGPPFGYELCAQRVRASDVEGYDFSHWRIAGVGAEPISPAVLDRFSSVFAPCGFHPKAFIPSYGMAENTLAISFAPRDKPYEVDWIDPDELTEELKAKFVDAENARGFVRCGKPLPGHDVKIVDEQGNRLGELGVGRILICGPSMMTGYFERPEATAEVLGADGWYDTGDIGYLSDGEIVVTGRHKDMIIINGRNIWPQDIEAIAERQPNIRSRDASAFGIVSAEGSELAVVVVQCNNLEDSERNELVQSLRREVYEELGITCLVELVPRHTLPRTSSGKLSRSGTRVGYLKRREAEKNGDKSADGVRHAV